MLASEDATLRMHGASGLSALTYQQHLLVNFKHGTIVMGGGISAMPSLHNALAVLFACVAWHLSRSLGRIMTGYAAIVWIGSIHLGWHYALDGVVAFVATIALWSLSGLMIQSTRGRLYAKPWLSRSVATAMLAGTLWRRRRERSR